MRYTQVAKRQPHHICEYGEPKTGKSTLAAKAAEEGWNLIWLSIDNGHIVLDKLSPAAQERVEIVIIPDSFTFPVGFDTFWKVSSGQPVDICNQHGQVNCSACVMKKLAKTDTNYWTHLELNSAPVDNTIVVFDNISQAAESAMNFIIHKRPDTSFPGWDEFRLQGVMMNKFLLNLQQARYNLIAIAQPLEGKLEDGTKAMFPCIGTGPFSSSNNAGRYFDSVIYSHIVNKKHHFVSKSTALMNVVSGSRNDVFIEDMEVPSVVPFFTTLSKEWSLKVDERDDKVGESKLVGSESSSQTPTDDGEVKGLDDSPELGDNVGYTTDNSSEPDKQSNLAAPLETVIPTTQAAELTPREIMMAKLAALKNKKG